MSCTLYYNLHFVYCLINSFCILYFVYLYFISLLYHNSHIELLRLTHLVTHVVVLGDALGHALKLQLDGEGPSGAGGDDEVVIGHLLPVLQHHLLVGRQDVGHDALLEVVVEGWLERNQRPLDKTCRKDTYYYEKDQMAFLGALE